MKAGLLLIPAIAAVVICFIALKASGTAPENAPDGVAVGPEAVKWADERARSARENGTGGVSANKWADERQGAALRDSVAGPNAWNAMRDARATGPENTIVGLDAVKAAAAAGKFDDHVSTADDTVLGPKGVEESERR